MSTEQAALTLAEEEGLPVFPCLPKDEQIGDKLRKAKSPLTDHGFKDASQNVEQISRWFSSRPDALIGVPTGIASNLLAVDIDPDGADWYAQNAARLECGRVHKTRRGHHLLYRMPKTQIGNSAGKLARGVDVRGEGGYIVWWPAHGLPAIGGIEDIAQPPAWLVNALIEPERKPVSKLNGSGIPEGGRNATLTSLAGKMRRAGASQGEIEVALGVLNGRCSPPLPAGELHTIAASVARYEPEDSAQTRPYGLLSIDELLTVRAPPDYIVDGLFEPDTSVGVVAPTESGKSLFAINVAACIATGKALHGRRSRQGLAAYLWGEGQAGAARRLQAVDRRHQLGLAGAPFVLSKVATSLIDPAEQERVRAALAEAQERYQQPLLLLVVDTLARFIAPGDESKAQDMNAFLAAVDALRGRATALICHHPGHIDATRGRGSSGWKAALDTEYTLAKEGDVVTVTCQKMKDGEKPAPFSFRIEAADTYMAREDGSPVQSVVLVPTEAAPISSRPIVTGKNQKLLLTELERRAALPDEMGVWTEGVLREIGRGVGMHRNSARDAVLGLRTLGYLIAAVGGSRLAHVPDKGPKDRNRTESTVSSQDKGPKTGTKAPVSLETVLPVPSAGPDSEPSNPSRTDQ